MDQLSFSKANRLMLGRAFAEVKRVDVAIDCALEGQMGKVYTDNLSNPTAFKIQTGPLCYFGGRVDGEDALAIVRDLETYSIIMPSAPEWIEVAREIHGDRLLQFPRYSFSSADLSIEHLDELLAKSPYKDKIERIDKATATRLFGDADHFIDLSDYESADDFVERGIGYCLKVDDEVVAGAFASLVCSKGAEVSIFVMPDYRRKGVATTMACLLLRHCLQNNTDPHWDAANVESCTLAEKLGYVQTDTYQAYFLRKQ